MASKTRAAERHRARTVIERALERLSPEDQCVVLEDLLFEAEQATKRTPTKRLSRASQVSKAESPESVRGEQQDEVQDREREEEESAESVEGSTPAVSAPAEETPLWQRIKDYCQQHPSRDGVYSIAELPKTLLPRAPGWRVKTTLYIAIKRKSPSSDRGPVKHPEFEMVGEGKFRLLEDAQSDGSAARRRKRKSRRWMEGAQQEEPNEVK